MFKPKTILTAMLAGSALAPAVAVADCKDLPAYPALKAALTSAVSAEGSGLNLDMWATIVDRDGVVCAVAFSGGERGAQWPGSRVISAQKANTGNAFSLDSFARSSGGIGLPPHANGLALSSANLYAAVQPGGSLYGLQHSNPVDTRAAYGGNPRNYGTAHDPMVGDRIGGVNVFGGALALYAPGRKIVGGLGVSGDTSCADHFIAWRVRRNLDLDYLAGVGGVSGDPARPDNIIFAPEGVAPTGFQHPRCLNTGDPASLPPVR